MVSCERLRLLRTSHDLSQAELSALIGITEGGYRGIEIGRRLPSVPVLIALANYYKVSLDYLCARDEYL